MSKEHEELKHWLELSAQNKDAEVAVEIRNNIALLSQGMITPKQSHRLRQELMWVLEGKLTHLQHETSKKT